MVNIKEGGTSNVPYEWLFFFPFVYISDLSKNKYDKRIKKHAHKFHQKNEINLILIVNWK